MLENDSNILGDPYRNCKDPKEKIRYAALYAVSRGNDVKTVANIMAVEESTIYDWINKWIFAKNASDKPRSGSASWRVRGLRFASSRVFIDLG